MGPLPETGRLRWGSPLGSSPPPAYPAGQSWPPPGNRLRPDAGLARIPGGGLPVSVGNCSTSLAMCGNEILSSALTICVGWSDHVAPAADRLPVHWLAPCL